MPRNTQLIFVLLFLFLFTGTGTWANNQASEIILAQADIAPQNITGNIVKNDSYQLDQITKQILAKEIEFERLNTRFRMETTLVTPWRQRRVFLYGETSASCSEAAAIITMPILYKSSNPKTRFTARRVNNDKSNLVAATRTSLVGQAVGAGGDILELGLNFLNYEKLRRKSFNPKAYSLRVHALRVELDSLIEQRRILLSNANLYSAESKTAQAESKLLDNIRDLSLLEYSRFHSATRRFWTYQNTAFVVDLIKNSTGITANIIGLAANHLRRPRMIGGAGVVSIINGAIILVTPSVGRVTGNLSGLAAARTASKELTNVQADNAKDFSLHRDQFVAIANDSTENTPYLNSARKREQLYKESESSATSMQQFLLNQRKRGQGTLRENIVFASIVGPPRLASGIENVLVGWKYYDNRVRASRLSAAGATGNAVGAGFAMFETARVEVSSELYNRKQARTNLLPRQQFTQRLQSLDEMEEALQ